MDRKQILVVEDEKDIAENLVYMFEKEGFSTQVAYGGYEALELLSKCKCDLIVTDLQMPNGNGIDLLKGLAHQRIEVPVFMFTGSSITIADIKEYEVDRIFRKPMDALDLISEVKTFLQSCIKI